jgi:O-acetylhomoserine (thiol)-lyase
VRYPGLPGDPAYARAQEYLPRGAGAILTFGVDKPREFIDKLQLFSLLANVGDAKSLVIHPASTTHQQLTPADQIASGVSDDLIRLSVGIEAIDDILADLDAALAAT